jgi:phosphoglycolate phosphatase-like HAD superfamily hydrolase
LGRTRLHCAFTTGYRRPRGATPCGDIPIDVVRRALDLGFVAGSCSDRPISFQQNLWAEHGIDMHFTVLKQNLEHVRAEFMADHYVHIGDSPIDKLMAEGAGFDFVHVIEDDLTSALQSLDLHLQG